MVFSAKTNGAEEWKAIISAISTLVEEATFEATVEGISFRGMDPSHVALIDINWPNSAFALFQKKQIYLDNNPNDLGIIPTLKEYSEDLLKNEIFRSKVKLGHWFQPWFIHFLKPCCVEVFHDDKLIFTDRLDCKHRLVQFDLRSENEKELFTWMNAIEKFKKKCHAILQLKTI